MVFDKFKIPVHMDYSGQKLAEKIFQRIVVSFAIIGFLVGYKTEQLSYTMLILGVGCVIAGMITLPPWPMYRKDPIRWQKSRTDEETQTLSSGKTSKKRH